MRFMIIVKATPDSEAGRWPADSDKLFEAMRIYHEELAKAAPCWTPPACSPATRAGASATTATSAPWWTARSPRARN
jgi:hypothetical protein